MISNIFYRPKLESGVKATKWSPCSVYTSSNPEVATVDQNGVITRLKDGDVTIKVTLKRQTVDGVVYKPALYTIGGGDDYDEVDIKKLFY